MTGRAAAPKVTKSCRTQGESVYPSVSPSVHLSIRLPLPHPQGFVSFGVQIQTVRPKSKQNSPNPSKIGPNLARKPEFWSELYHFGPLDLDSGFCYLDSGFLNPHPSLRDPDLDLWDPESDLRDPGSGLKALNSGFRNPNPGLRDSNPGL